MTHYSPPAGAQMLLARAVTSLCPLERTKGSSFPSSSLSSLPSPMQFLWVSAGSWCVAQPVLSSHPREPPCEQFPLCQASQHFQRAPCLLSKAAAATESKFRHLSPLLPLGLRVCAGGWCVCACTRVCYIWGGEKALAGEHLFWVLSQRAQ